MPFFVMNREPVRLTRVNEQWASFREVLASCVCTHHFTDSFTDSGRSDLPNSLLLMQQNLEARVGIEQVSQLSKTPPKPFGSGNFSKCCTDKEVTSNKWLNQANNA
jgi:hypothetical protein